MLVLMLQALINMHPLRFLFISLSLASAVYPRPLEVTPVQSSSIVEETRQPDVPFTGEIPHWVSPVKTKANMMLRKMHYVISDPDKEEHKKIINASFGPGCLNALRTAWIGRRIQKMDRANVRLRTSPSDVGTRPRFSPVTPLAMTRFIEKQDGVHDNFPTTRGGFVADSVKFGPTFHQY
jgi:hypothetical protein